MATKREKPLDLFGRAIAGASGDELLEMWLRVGEAASHGHHERRGCRSLTDRGDGEGGSLQHADDADVPPPGRRRVPR